MRMTRQRKAIVAALRSAGRPLSPSEILVSASEDLALLNLATVYRNLKSMREAGEIAAVECVGQSARYELAHLGHHHHFLCEACDRLFDLPGCDEAAILRLAPAGFEVRQHHVQLSGRCEACVAG